MEKKLHPAVSCLGRLLMVGIGGYGGLMLLSLFLFSLPVVAWCITGISLSIFLPLLLLIWGKGKRRWFKPFLAVCLAVLLCCSGVLGYRAWVDAIPKVDDRNLMLRQWFPFEADTLAVALDEEPTLLLTQEEASELRIDGATALYPVYASFARSVFEPSDAYTSYIGQEEPTLRCRGTTDAYLSLMKGECDVIFCAGPSKAQQQTAADRGLTLHMTPIGQEAFVFFVNSRNPVTNVTVQDIQGIYTGDITNWKALGGKNQRIRAYQRDEGSGSQSALQMVMAGLPLMEAPTEDIVGSMGGIITRTAADRNYDGAIGFTFRFYANEMVGNDQIRLLSLNGVAPTKETIRDGSYPISSCFYAITAGPIGQPAPEDSNPVLRAFLDWCTGEQGQQIVEQVGYVRLDASNP